MDINDLTIVLANYNQSLGSPAAGMAAVPEPGVLALVAAGSVGLLACSVVAETQIGLSPHYARRGFDVSSLPDGFLCRVFGVAECRAHATVTYTFTALTPAGSERAAYPLAMNVVNGAPQAAGVTGGGTTNVNQGYPCLWGSAGGTGANVLSYISGGGDKGKVFAIDSAGGCRGKHPNRRARAPH